MHKENETDQTTPAVAAPKKFTDPKTGTLDVAALLASYRELERKLGSNPAQPRSDQPRSDQAPSDQALSDQADNMHALGVPETPEQYRIDILEDYLERDPEMEAILHQAGFTESQVQLVYDLAAERLAPLMVQVASAARGATDAARLEAHFGGKDRWKGIQRQLRKWGQKNLPDDAFNALCCSYDGVMAVHRMMGSGGEPGLANGGDGGDVVSEQQLKRMMNDPRYWRDHDPALSRRVQHGFKQLYPGGT